MKILVTGFDPFGGESENPACNAVKKLEDNINGAAVVKMEIPTVFKKSAAELEKAIEREQPDAIICVGQAGGRSDITIERVAINVDDASIEDNEGNKPADEIISSDGQTAYFSKLPIKEIVKNIREHGIPASVSNTAGTFVCNHIMYSLLYMIERKYPDKLGGFIHVPYIPSQVINKANTPSMSTETITKALACAIETVVEQLKCKR